MSILEISTRRYWTLKSPPAAGYSLRSSGALGISLWKALSLNTAEINTPPISGRSTNTPREVPLDWLPGITGRLEKMSFATPTLWQLTVGGWTGTPPPYLHLMITSLKKIISWIMDRLVSSVMVPETLSSETM